MTIKTLRTLIEDTIKNDNLMAVMPGDTAALQKKIMKVIDLYAEDNSHPVAPINPRPINPFESYPKYGPEIPCGIPDEVPYSTICPCNPANGGSGICGCTMGNQMVKNPAKYGAPLTNLRYTTGTGTTMGFPSGTTITNTPGGHTLTIKTTN